MKNAHVLQQNFEADFFKFFEKITVSVFVTKFMHFSAVLLVACALFFCQVVRAQTTIDIANVPLLALKSAPGLVMLTMSRDHRLYYAAYNEVSDIDGDGVIDVGFKPSIQYYGYFVSDRCYHYDSVASPARFVPISIASAANGCASSTGRWHGNWMNWMATSRMDALRKVLYGGQRVTDTASSTILQAAHIPPDSHIWGKEYRPAPKGPDTYLIQNYTPMSAPASGKMHIFLMKSEGSASTVYTNLSPPTLRAIADVDIDIDRVWLWASSERPVGGSAGSTGYNRPGSRTVVNTAPTSISYGLPGFSGGTTTYSATSFSAFVTPPTIRVEACVAIGGVRESTCTGYPVSSPTIWKPTGVLHDYSTTDSLKFGLLTGSYYNNYSGGVLRKDIGSFKDEFDASTGIFNSTVGISKTIDRLTNYGFNIGNQEYSCGFKWTSLRTERECVMWGAPVAEMMYEGLRYFTDKQPMPAFVAGVDGASSPDTRITLPTKTTWLNPYRPKSSGGSPICSKPVQMVIADPITSFDSDQLPGAAYSPVAGYGAAITNDLLGLQVSTLADQIWNDEFGASSKNFFIGQTTASNYDGNPTAKPANSFKFIRGHAPDETTSQGSYYAASISRFGRETGVPIRSSSTGSTTIAKVDTISIALGSVVPRIELLSSGRLVSLVPFSKMVGGCGNPASPVSTPSGFQPTGLITGVFIDKIANSPVPNTDPSINSGRPFARFMVSFSDGDQGGDNEADANVYYTMSINSSSQLVVRMDSYYQATCAQQNMGYVISGTTDDGVYLEVRGVSAGSQIYYLDTTPGQSPALAAGRFPGNTTAISNSSASRTFILTSAPATAGYVPRDPLWYAAKYGGAGVIDASGDPTNYFKIANPAQLPQQMGQAFRSAAALAAVASTSVVGAGNRSAGSAAIYQANYDSLTWSSRVYAFSINASGVASNTATWEASAKIPALGSRNLFLGRGTSTYALTSAGYSGMTSAEQSDFGNTQTYAYLIGDTSKEERKGGTLRNRGTTAGSSAGSVIGDIVNSDPQVIGKKDFGYTPSDSSYASFLATIDFEMLAVGSNGGYFHIFDAEPDATGGGELLGFMPQAARPDIKGLASTGYTHRNLIDGPIGLGHAKIRTPADSTVKWRSIAVGAGGIGVPTIFAIDTSTKTFTASSFLWELNPATGLGSHTSTFGQIIGRPVIGKIPLAGGTWVAIFGNGYNSSSGLAKLYVVRLNDGSILKVLDAGITTGNGMGFVEATRKTTGNMDTIDYVYGADYKGGIWRFDLSDTNSNNWQGQTSLLYRTPSTQPVTAELRVGPAPTHANTTGGKMVYFGTGQFLASTDSAVTTAQALYGIYDDLISISYLTPVVTSTALISTTISAVAGGDVRTVTAVATPYWYQDSTKKGWTVPLAGANITSGERVMAPPVFYPLGNGTSAIIFTSIVPSADDCTAGLDTWVTAIDPLTGGYKKTFKNGTFSGIKINGGSPRGVFVLSDGGAPILYTSQTIFTENPVPTSYSTIAGGEQSVSINGVIGKTRVLGIELESITLPIPLVNISNRQVWRQLK